MIDRSPRLNVLTALFCVSLLAATLSADLDDELHREASWQYPSVETVQLELEAWLEEQELDEETRGQIAEVWQDAEQSLGGELLQRVAQTIGLADPEAAAFLRVCLAPRSSVSLPECALLSDEAAPAVVRDNLRLILGSWLADHQLYDEAWQQLAELDAGDVADPARLLFYQAAVHYRLRETDPGLVVLRKLLEQSDAIPQRYATLARLMESDLKTLEADSLDEVARIMDSIHVRLGHGRAGKRVRQEEDDVVAKLDKMIEELEKQRQQQQMQQGKDGKGGKQSLSPMQESNPAGGRGEGNVTPKKLSDDTDWGNLPPKDREEALQRLGNEFPSHYREVIEEYFRNLARKEAETP